MKEELLILLFVYALIYSHHPFIYFHFVGLRVRQDLTQGKSRLRYSENYCEMIVQSHKPSEKILNSIYFCVARN